MWHKYCIVNLFIEELTFACFTNLMSTMEHCFPPKPGVSQRMANLQSLLQVNKVIKNKYLFI